MKPRSDDLYVYALAEPGLPPHFTILGRRLHTLALGDAVTAVVERGARPDRTTEAVRQQHDIVTRLAARTPAVLPARFGSLTNPASLQALVSTRRTEIVEALAEVRGCVQMTVRVFRTSAGTDTQPRPVARTGTEFMNRLHARAREVPPAAGIVHQALAGQIRTERVVAGEGSLLVTAYHLVPEPQIAGYRRRASKLQTKLRPQVVTVTGPWPAFAFAPELF